MSVDEKIFVLRTDLAEALRQHLLTQIKVESSNLHSISLTLLGVVVTFKTGWTYVYRGAGAHEFDAIMNAESKGKAFNMLLKPLPFERLV